MPRSIWKRHHCFRQYFGPVNTFPLLFENEDFLLLFDLVCFVLFSPAWPIDDNSVSGDNSYHLIKMLSKVEIFEHVCFLFTCRRTKTGGFRIPWCHKSYATSCYCISIVFKLRGWAWTLKTIRVEAYFSESGDKVSVSKNIRIRVDELLFIIYQNDYNLLKLAILIFRVCLDL